MEMNLAASKNVLWKCYYLGLSFQIDNKATMFYQNCFCRFLGKHPFTNVVHTFSFISILHCKFPFLCKHLGHIQYLTRKLMWMSYTRNEIFHFLSVFFFLILWSAKTKHDLYQRYAAERNATEFISCSALLSTPQMNIRIIPFCWKLRAPSTTWPWRSTRWNKPIWDRTLWRRWKSWRCFSWQM